MFVSLAFSHFPQNVYFSQVCLTLTALVVEGHSFCEGAMHYKFSKKHTFLTCQTSTSVIYSKINCTHSSEVCPLWSFAGIYNRLDGDIYTTNLSCYGQTSASLLMCSVKLDYNTNIFQMKPGNSNIYTVVRLLGILQLYFLFLCCSSTLWGFEVLLLEWLPEPGFILFVWRERDWQVTLDYLLLLHFFCMALICLKFMSSPLVGVTFFLG